MKKTILSLCLMGVFGEYAFAGGMGDALVKDYLVPYVSGEAAVTWNTTKSVTIFGNPPLLTKQLWGGRGAVGVAHHYPTRWGYTGEVGWGYYGSTSSANAGTSGAGSLAITNNSYLYGFDILAGLSYDFMPVELFVKAGAMAENRRVKGSAIFNSINGTTSYVSTNVIKTVSTNVLPEIKVGGLYSLYENLSLSLAYMHVFGNNNFAAAVTGAFANPVANSTVTSVVDAQNPSLDSFMFGLVYQFS